MIPEQDGAYHDIDETAYHADRSSLSVSGAKLLLSPSCPARFRYVMDHPQPPKAVFDFGTLAHALILGKGPEIEVLDPAVHGLKSDGTVADVPAMTGMWKKAAAVARAAGKLPVSIDDYAAAIAMRQAVQQHPIAGELFTHGRPEVSLYHQDDESGVRLRGRVDWLRNDGRIIDLKTSQTANPSELVRKFWQYGYFMQDSWYRDLVEAPRGTDCFDAFTFVVVEKTPPYLVTVIRYDADAVEEGRRLNRLAINTYAACMESGVWPGYSDQAVTIGLPRWAYTEANEDAAADLIKELEGIA